MNPIIKKIIIFLITGYQKTLSPDHGLFKNRFPYGFCRFYPSCSQYTKQAVDRHGVFRGLFMGFGRLIRCNPWHKPSVDLPI